MTAAAETTQPFDAERMRLTAMLAIAREAMLHDKHSAMRELRRLSRVAAGRFDEDDELVIACERSMLEADTRSMPAAVRLARLRALGERAAQLPETNRERRAVANYEASALRHVDRSAGISAYRDELALRERIYPPGHRSVRVSVLNLCHALRSYGASVDDLTEAHGLLTAQWETRRYEHGPDSPITLMAAQAYVHNALEGARLGHPFESPAALIEKAEEIVEARQRILGPEHRRTVYARITLADARGSADQIEQAIWSLLALRAQADAVGLDDPERIPLLLMSYLSDSANLADRRAAATYGREALDGMLNVYGADHPRVLDVERQIGRIMSSLD